jgi:Escherichia/Staphylococcus phage prohead protease
MNRFLSTSIEALGNDEVGVIASTSKPGRDGHVVEPAGIDLSNYRRNPIVLWQHDPGCPVATCSAVGLENGALAARIIFAPAGASDIADQARALVKAGIVKGVSIGFDPIEVEPLDPRNPRGGQRMIRSELLEISFVSVPADTGAGVTARGLPAELSRIAFHSLPRVPVAATQRAAAKVAALRGGKILSHAGHVWTLQQLEREKENAFTREARQADLEMLRHPRWRGA